MKKILALRLRSWLMPSGVEALGLATLAAIGISLFPVIPAHAATTGTNDIVCRFIHRADIATAKAVRTQGARHSRSHLVSNLA